MKIVYIIMAHHFPQQLARLVDRLNAPSVSILIHIDGNVDDERHREIRTALKGKSRVYFLPRYRTPWASWSFVLAILEGLEQTIRANWAPDYVILLSGQDYPLRTPEQIELFLSQHKGTSFIDVRQLPDYNWNWHGTMDRFRGQQLPSGMKPFGGSTWWALSGDCAAYVKGAADGNRELIRIFESVGFPDEHVFPTIIGNSPFRDRIAHEPPLTGPRAKYGVHYIDWHRGSPKVLGVEDFERLLASPALFARKFDMTRDSEILDLIDAHLSHAAGNEAPRVATSYQNADPVALSPVSVFHDEIQTRPAKRRGEAAGELRNLAHPAKRKKRKRTEAVQVPK